MKKVLLAIAAAGTLFVMMPTDAHAWKCGARSPTGGWGVGWHSSQYRARRIALNYCAVNTPRGYTCRITYCT